MRHIDLIRDFFLPVRYSLRREHRYPTLGSPARALPPSLPTVATTALTRTAPPSPSSHDGQARSVDVLGNETFGAERAPQPQQLPRVGLLQRRPCALPSPTAGAPTTYTDCGCARRFLLEADAAAAEHHPLRLVQHPHLGDVPGNPARRMERAAPHSTFPVPNNVNYNIGDEKLSELNRSVQVIRCAI